MTERHWNVGESHGQAKLTAVAVREMRRTMRSGGGYRGLIKSWAHEFGVSHTAICRALRGDTWKHVQ